MKSEPAPKQSVFENTVIYILILGLIISITTWLNNNYNIIKAFLSSLPYHLINFFAKYVVFAICISLVLIVLIIIYAIRLKNIQKKVMSTVLPPDGDTKIKTENSLPVNPKWKLVIEHMASEEASNWKLAIIEADIILSELLNVLNLPGEGVGEKLKNIETGDFNHIDDAWEAHKIRNAIAHQGSDFLLTKREAKRIIELYKSVFEEFEVI